LRPALKRTIALLQIAVPSRLQVDTYQKLQTQLAGQVTEINGRHGEIDWSPIRYLTRGFSQIRLAGFYRMAQVGLVTSLRDGMNLVAKEYVAAQDPSDPGVLVLSKFAGAARQLDAALLVNPHDIEGLASAIGEAFSMPADERRERWDAMMKLWRRRRCRRGSPTSSRPCVPPPWCRTSFPKPPPCCHFSRAAAKQAGR
jgi:trehalose 6-phosphate synthase